MDILQSFLNHAVIVVLMLPVMLVLAWPFLIAAVLLYRFGRRWLADDGQRLLPACGVAALGIAPAFDAYRFPRPIHLTLWDGDSVGWGAAIVSFLLTWFLAWLQLRMLTHRRRAAATA
jgi:hypothetical protein